MGLKHIDLFSGIGGFALAVDRVWPNSKHIFCDNDDFCRAVLKKHWPKTPIVSDIRRFTTNTLIDEHRPESREAREEDGLSEVSRQTLDTWGSSGTDILTGGFPCQPFSQAGRRRGTADDRYLWPEMFRVIREFKPTWVIAENVRGLVTWSDGLVLEQVCTDLEGEGYEVQPLIIPAVAVNAPHRRDRVWIVANRRHVRQTKPEVEAMGSEQSHSWDRNWLEVATELCRMDDGIPKRLDRNPRLKALGNAIVPAVAEEIMRAIDFVCYNNLK